MDATSFAFLCVFLSLTTIPALLIFQYFNPPAPRLTVKQIWRDEASTLYAQHKIESNNPICAFDAQTAEIIQDDEVFRCARDSSAIIGYQLTRISRNPAGEYFWFLIDSNPAQPIISRQMNYKVARALLNEKFILPSHANSQSISYNQNEKDDQYNEDDSYDQNDQNNQNKQKDKYV